MFRLGFALFAIWLVGFAYLFFLSISRWLFDEPPETGPSRTSLLFLRFLSAFAWPLMLLSAGGRRKINYIMKGF